MRRSMVVIELAADTQFARDLAAGGVFVPGTSLRLAEECDLVVRGADHELVLPARVVYVDKDRGAGLELIGFSTEVREQLAQLAPFVRPSMVFVAEPVIEESAFDGAPDRPSRTGREAEPHAASGPVPLVMLTALDDDLALVGEDGDSADTAAFPQLAAASGQHELDGGDDLAIAVAGSAPTHPRVARPRGSGDDWQDDDSTSTRPDGAEAASDDAGDDETTETDPERTGRTRPTREPFARNVHERLRGLNLAAQIKLAMNGEQHERIVLERLYGKNVWEPLLRNPRLSPPEVSRIARMGSLPRPLIEIIVSNNAWLQVPEIRRALLSNPRLAADQIVKVLRLTPKHELKLAAIQTAYPVAVRNAAKMMILRGE